MIGKEAEKYLDLHL